MKVYVTSVGETTTDLVRWQLKRMGFNVVLLGKKQSWYEKYCEFIQRAEKDDRHCVRIDADVIPNKHLKRIADGFMKSPSYMLVQFHTYGFFRNELSITCPVIYHADAIKIISDNLKHLDPNRPETSAWRLPLINDDTYTSRAVVGIHGLFQDEETIARHIKHKIDRKQNDFYDWDFVQRAKPLWMEVENG